jgi:alpha-tubulin suppressor-like RCC1 family protein
MKSWSVSIILSVILFSQISSAEYCAFLKDVRCGESHTLAIDDNNNLWACGESYATGLGSGDRVYSLQRVKGLNNVGFLSNVIAFDAGWYHSLAVTSDGLCLAWGTADGTYGLLGNGPNEGDSNVPIKVHGLNNDSNGLKHIVKVSAGRSGKHSIAVDSKGYTYAWGFNGLGQCGIGTNLFNPDYPYCVLSTGTDPNFTFLGDEAFIVDVEAGVDHSLALQRLTDGGCVYEWGDWLTTPQKVHNQSGNGFLQNIVDIATCEFSMAADADGDVWTWYTGGNPEKVEGLPRIKKVAAGRYNDQTPTCLCLDVNDYVWQWNLGGQPARVPGGDMGTQYLQNINAIDEAFGDFQCAIDKYGRGWSWGSQASAFGGIGNVQKQYPVQMLCPQISPVFYLETDYEIQGTEPNCAKPFIGWGIDDNYLVFEIAYGNPVIDSNRPDYIGPVQNIDIIERLPYEVNIVSSDPCGVYNPNEKTITWHINSLAPGDFNSVNFTVAVNNYAKPCGKIINSCFISGSGYEVYDDINVPVCPYGGEIIYVDRNANGFDNGTDWQNAYTKLPDALETAANNNCIGLTAIWVANGVYDANQTTGAFLLADGVGLIGNFAGDEQSPLDRDFSNPDNQTILKGKNISSTLLAENIFSGLIDGFTFKCSDSNDPNASALKLSNSTLSIVNCKFINNKFDIYAENYSYPEIHNCSFYNSADCSIYFNSTQPNISYCIFDGNDNAHYGISLYDDPITNILNCSFSKYNSAALYVNDSDLVIQRTIIKNNNDYGIKFYRSSTVEILNSLIYNNFNAGLYFDNAVGIPLVSNCTICDNGNCGIRVSQTGADPNISNCIIHDNDVNDLYRTNGNFNHVRYSCLQHTRIGAGNFVADPCFKSSDDFHITKNSRCRNAGNPNLNYANEFDIDDQIRVQYGRIDIGCDEFFGGLSDYAPQDGIVNFMDYRYLAANWQHNETNYSIDEDNDVDIHDLTYFANEWLWQEEPQMQMMMSQSSSLAVVGTTMNLNLMLSASDSLAKRPLRLSEKSQKFYDITPSNTISAKQKELQSIRNQKYLTKSESKKVMSNQSPISNDGVSLASPSLWRGSCLADAVGVLAETTVGDTAAFSEVEQSSESIQIEPEPVDVNGLLNWLDDLWLNDETIRNSMSEEEYLNFRQSLEQSE